jgi:ParB-like chromosome segregation protein Spo0J
MSTSVFHTNGLKIKTESIVLKAIRTGPRVMPLDERRVRNLMVSIKRIGLLQPIIVCRPASQMGVHLVCGLQRLEACRRLKHREILARGINGDTPEIREWRKLAEVGRGVSH